MNTTCDRETMETIESAIGMRLDKVMALRYPGVLAYSQVITCFSDGNGIKFDLRAEAVSPKFEVFVARARPVSLSIDFGGWDWIQLSDFSVATASILRREQWAETVHANACLTVGANGTEQKMGPIGSQPSKRGAVVVDSGICLRSVRDAELSLDADMFPLTFQLRYELASSPLPIAQRINAQEYLPE